MNGIVVSEFVSPKPESYSNVKVYAAGKYVQPSNAWIRNLQASTSRFDKVTTSSMVTASIDVQTLPAVTGPIEVVTAHPPAMIGVATLPPARPAHCSPGVCREFANYWGDPGGYDKMVRNITRVGACRRLCRRDVNCCHWVHYGKKGVPQNYSARRLNIFRKYFLQSRGNTEIMCAGLRRRRIRIQNIFRNIEE